MTMGAVIGLNELGIRIPEEISLVGFDNLPFARACNPKLTIVSQPTEKSQRLRQGLCWNVWNMQEMNPDAVQKSWGQPLSMENPLHSFKDTESWESRTL